MLDKIMTALSWYVAFIIGMLILLFVLSLIIFIVDAITEKIQGYKFIKKQERERNRQFNKEWNDKIINFPYTDIH